MKFSETLARAAAKWGYFQRSNGPFKQQNETAQRWDGGFPPAKAFGKFTTQIIRFTCTENCQTQFHLTERLSEWRYVTISSSVFTFLVRKYGFEKCLFLRNFYVARLKIFVMNS